MPLTKINVCYLHIQINQLSQACREQLFTSYSQCLCLQTEACSFIWEENLIWLFIACGRHLRVILSLQLCELCFLVLYFSRKNLVERPRCLNILVALEYLGTLHREDQRESLQGNHATERAKDGVQARYTTESKIKLNPLGTSILPEIQIFADF